MYFLLQLLAYDGGSPAKSGSVDISIVIIDANDNAPAFSQPVYNVTVAEDTAVRTTILQVGTSISKLMAF